MSVKEIHGYNVEYSSSSDTLSKIVHEWEEHSRESLEHILKRVRESSEKKIMIGDEENIALRYKGGQDYSLEKKEY